MNHDSLVSPTAGYDETRRFFISRFPLVFDQFPPKTSTLSCIASHQVNKIVLYLHHAMTKLTGKRVLELFFHQCKTDPKTWICRYGKKRRVTGSDYTNIVTQVRRDHLLQYTEAHNRDNAFPKTYYSPSLQY